jgi:UDP-N-acetylglucosamine--N-acetylmuramyl-(pentapeptide) pyrophosphoryl-undecaprenol N-acetylglucosamine transferase
MQNLLEGGRKKLRILLSAGGTAGHVLPALTVLKRLQWIETQKSSDATSSSTPALAGVPTPSALQVLFVGEMEGMERDLVQREGVKFVAIQAGAMHGVGAARMLRGAFRMLAGMAGAWNVVRQFKPDVVFLTGGFVGVPVSMAAWLRRVPAVVYLPDIEPGMALKVMARFATKVATTTDASAPYISGSKMVVTGYPVREAFAKTSRQQGRRHFNISNDDKVLLVVGGSKGSQSINRAIAASLPRLLSDASVTVIHVTGTRDWAEIRAVRDALPEAQRAHYLAFEYLHEDMADAMAAADLAVCRSGASALGELPFLGLPAVLVPYPYAWRYQRVNAEYLVNRNAAVILEDSKLGAELAPLVMQLINDNARLSAMHRSLLDLSGRTGADNIAQLLTTVGTKSKVIA